MVGSVHGPQHQGLVGFYDEHRHWRQTTPLAPEAARVLPETVPQAWLATHPIGCGCAPCARFPDPTQLRRLKLRSPRRPA